MIEHMYTPPIQLKNSLFAAFLVAILTISGACEGPVGPVGPEGPPGIPGADAKELISIKYEVLEGDWVANGNVGEPGYFLELDFDVPEITQNIIENGVVLVYYYPPDAGYKVMLPYTFISADDPPYTELLDFIMGTGFINLKSQADDFQATQFTGIFQLIIGEAIPIGFEPENFM